MALQVINMYVIQYDIQFGFDLSPTSCHIFSHLAFRMHSNQVVYFIVVFLFVQQWVRVDAFA